MNYLTRIVFAICFAWLLPPSITMASPKHVSSKAMSQTSPIQVLSVAASALPINYRGMKAGSVKRLKLDKPALIAMKTGDKFTLHLPEGHYVVVHDNRIVHPNGDTSWIGYLDPAGQNYRLMLTLGRESLSGQLTTPKAEYQIEQQGREYWLINRKAAGFKEMPLHDDALEPPVPPKE